jgi:hypothetical protein
VSLRLVWDKSALRDLARASNWSQSQALTVYESMNRMAEVGWSWTPAGFGELHEPFHPARGESSWVNAGVMSGYRFAIAAAS